MQSGQSAVPPLIITATLPKALHAAAQKLRQVHFPANRNFVPAHVTLFHALPGQLVDEVRGLLARIASQTPPVPATLAGVMDLGGGTAFRIESPDMLALRAQIADHFHGMLTAQDSHKPRLHVTIQNKVARADAKALQQHLNAGFRPQRFVFAGLALHRYLGGPWEPVGNWALRGSERTSGGRKSR